MPRFILNLTSPWSPLFGSYVELASFCGQMFTDQFQAPRKERWHERRRFQFGALVVGAIAFLLIGIVIGHASSDTNAKSSVVSGGSSSNGVPKPGRPTLLLVGDSLTQYAANPDDRGWVSLLQFKYVRAADVINRGLAGYNTKAFVKSALPTILSEMKTSLSPSFITLWLGANDAAAKDGRHGIQALPVEDYQTNMVTIITLLRAAAPQAKLLVITPPTIDADQRRDIQEDEGFSREPPDRTNEHTALYVAACRTATESVDGVALLDMYGYLMTTYPNATDRRKYFGDGLHFNAAGYTLAFELIETQMLKLLPTFTNETLQIPNFHAVVNN